ncbi:hypothetical protein LXL04_033382 [Taraxacum kok-saghyz]
MALIPICHTPNQSAETFGSGTSCIGRRQNPSRREAAVHVFRPSLPETLAQSHSSSSCYRAGDLGFLDTLYQIGDLREASSPLLWLELQVSLVIVFCSSNSQVLCFSKTSETRFNFDIFYLQEIERQNTASAQNNEQHSKEPHTPIKNQTPENPDVVLYYGPDLGVSPLNFRDVLLQSQALEGITMSMFNRRFTLCLTQIVGAPNEEEILLLHDLYRMCLTGGEEVHGVLVKRILDLSKAFSVYSEEVLPSALPRQKVPKVPSSLLIEDNTIHGKSVTNNKMQQLDMRAFDELRKLEMFFKEEDRHGCSVVDLYELVQHAGNILPKLYLLCTVGSVYIKSKEASANRDEDTVMDAVEFVLQNFSEMNKLWVWMEVQCLYYYYYIDFGDPELRPSFGISGLQRPARVRDKMEKERNELRDLFIFDCRLLLQKIYIAKRKLERAISSLPKKHID